MNRNYRYTFEFVTHCNMCGDGSADHKVLGSRLSRSQGFRPHNKCGIAVSVLKCKSCGLIYANPQPIPSDLQDHYGVPPESYWTPSYFVMDPTYFQSEINQFKQLYPLTAGLKALDIGAGIGKAVLALQSAGFDAHAIEASTTFHEMAISKMGISADKIQLASIETAQFNDEFFDFITFGAVLEHLYDPSGSIEKAMRWLKPGGLMHIEVPSSNHLLAKIINLYYKVRGTHYVTHLSPMHDPYHLYEFDLKSFQRHAEKTKTYELCHHHIMACSTAPFPRILSPLLVYLMDKTATGMQLTVWLRKK